MSDDLLSWLRATIEGDKAAAEAVADPAEISMGAEYVDNCGSDEAAEHIRRHDIRDTIARCKAELALLDEHAPKTRCTGHLGPYMPCDEFCEYDCEGCSGISPCRTVSLLASGYQHRAGYPGDALE